MIDIARLRDAIKSLDRTSLIALAKDIGAARHELEDIAFGGMPGELITPAAYKSLCAWFEVDQLRKLLVQPHNAQDLDNLDIDHERIKAFIEGRVELTPSEMIELFDFGRGKFGVAGIDKRVKEYVPPPMGTLGTASAMIDPEMARRGAIINKLKAVPLADLERLAAKFN